jgi:hypothetical protein
LIIPYKHKIRNRWNSALKICLFLLCISSTFHAGKINLSGNRLFVSSSIKFPVKETIIRVLQEEVNRRTDSHWGITNGWKGSSIIALALSSDDRLNGRALPEKTKLSLQAESFSMIVEEGASQTVIWLIGANEHGVLFAAGHLLRTSLFTGKHILSDYYLETESPDWLRGVVSGPDSLPPSDTRYRLSQKYIHCHIN